MIESDDAGRPASSTIRNLAGSGEALSRTTWSAIRPFGPETPQHPLTTDEVQPGEATLVRGLQIRAWPREI
jgi:hypothetical protein